MGKIIIANYKEHCDVHDIDLVITLLIGIKSWISWSIKSPLPYLLCGLGGPQKNCLAALDPGIGFKDWLLKIETYLISALMQSLMSNGKITLPSNSVGASSTVFYYLNNCGFSSESSLTVLVGQ